MVTRPVVELTVTSATSLFTLVRAEPIEIILFWSTPIVGLPAQSEAQMVTSAEALGVENAEA